MKKTGLKSFNITSFTSEIEFNKRVAPITKKINTLNRNNEKKSLESHKDFLSKEKKHKKKLKQLSEKSLLRNQRIERATENKLKKFINAGLVLDEELAEFTADLEVRIKQENELLDAKIEVVNQEEIVDLDNVKKKFDESIATYNEKLDSFNSNFKNNHKKHQDQLNEYQEIAKKHIENIREIKKAFSDELLKEYNAINTAIEKDNKRIELRESDTTKEMSRTTTQVQKDANIKISKINDSIKQIIDRNNSKYDSFVSEIEKKVEKLNTDFITRKELIEKDLEINLEALTNQLESSKNPTKVYIKSIEMKMELYQLRASATLNYEESLHEQHIRFLLETINDFVEQKETDDEKYQKLQVFLLQDQQQMKDTSAHFKNLNFELQKQLSDVERTNNAFILKHAKLRKDYLDKYNEIYNEFKLATMSTINEKLERIGAINLEIDEIEKFIDTADPLKEIQLSKIRESIERSQVKDKYQVKRAQVNHERAVVRSDFERDLALEQLEHKLKTTKNNKTMDDIRAKEALDIELEKAKLKYSHGDEDHRLRLASIRMERNILKSNYETETGFHTHRKDLAEIDVEYEIALYEDEIANKINLVEKERDYLIEVVNKKLIEENLKLNDQISNVKVEISDFDSKFELELVQEKNKFDVFKNQVEADFDAREKLIDQALVREVRNSKLALAKSTKLINERLGKFEISNQLFENFISDMKQNIKDDTINNEQRIEIMKNDTLLLERSKEFISKIYSYFSEVIDFMHNLEKETINEKLASVSNESEKKKLLKFLDRSESEFSKQVANLANSKKSHISSITDEVSTGIKHITNFVFEEKSLVDTITELFESIYTELTTLNNNIVDEVKQLFSVLTKPDEELISNAEENAVRAKELLVEEKEETIKPKAEEYELFISVKEKEKENHKRQMEEKIDEINSKINFNKENATKKINAIKEEQAKFLDPLYYEQNRIKETTVERLQQKHDEIDSILADMDKEFQASLAELEDKVKESEKLLSYEQQIFDIAKETAETRYNEKLLATENTYLSLLKTFENRKKNIYQNHENSLKETHNKLVELTKKYESNVFSTEPKLEESVGDAQKLIDYEVSEKRKRLEILVDEKEKNILSLMEKLDATYSACYDKLLDNYNFYFDKLKLIRIEYLKDNRKLNSLIDKQSNDFALALFEISKNKHEQLLEKLAEITNEAPKEDD